MREKREGLTTGYKRDVNRLQRGTQRYKEIQGPSVLTASTTRDCEVGVSPTMG